MFEFQLLLLIMNGTNYNHAETKIYSHLKDNHSGQDVVIDLVVKNTSSSSPGSCAGCRLTTPYFADQNPSFELNVFEGSTGVNP